MIANPARSGIDVITGITAPITHTSWKRTSKRAKDRPRLASGGVALNQRVEPELGAGRRDGDRCPHRRGTGQLVESHRDEGHHDGDTQHHGEDALLGHANVA